MTAERPHGVSVAAVRYWVGRRTGYSGTRKRIADAATKHSLDWCSLNANQIEWANRMGGLKDGEKLVAKHKKESKKACRRYVKKHLKVRSTGFIEVFLIPVLLNLVISVIVRLIVDWLFDDPVSLKAVRLGGVE